MHCYPALAPLAELPLGTDDLDGLPEGKGQGDHCPGSYPGAKIDPVMPGHIIQGGVLLPDHLAIEEGLAKATGRLLS